MSSLETASAVIARIAREQGPGVVGFGHGWEVGSGFVAAEGEVIVPARGLPSEQPSVVFLDGRRAGAEVKGVDPDVGLALLATDTGDAPPLVWATPVASLGIGAPVVALASPGGRGLRVTAGFVAAEPRAFRGPRGRRVPAGIEHTAPLPRGSGGGPLVDLEGRVVGINATRMAGGLILALPADAALRARVQAMRTGDAAPARRLGVAVAPPRIARRLRRSVGLPERDGALVRAVEDDSPAARAGIAPGDLITAASGRAIDHVDVLHEALDALADDAPLTLTVLRGTEERELDVPFG